ncbi:cupin domain-containing protein [Pinirhizobacter sp.]|uniref:cupin domain-containing protein n=1 Tax=Pinirhizobacter sp. TaxID=2950432 RepID=UPI002F409057
MKKMAGKGTSDIVRKPLLSASLAAGTRVGRVEVKEITLVEGQPTGRHRHPAPVICYVVKGTILFQVQGQEARHYPAGSAIFEPADTVIEHFDPVDGPATFVANYLLEEESQPLIQMLPVGGN